MKCSVCGSDSKADASVCASCGAAMGSAAATLRPEHESAAGPGAADASRESPPARTRTGGIVLALVALGVVGYFIYRVMTPIGPATTEAPSQSTVGAPDSDKRDAPAMTLRREPSVGPEATAPAEPARPSQGASRVGPEPVPAKAPAVAPRAAVPPRPTTPKAASKAQAPSATAVAPAPIAAPDPARPDRWQLMTDATARCARENIIDRLVCEQKIGIQFCEGYWGKVPQCPSAHTAEQGK